MDLPKFIKNSRKSLRPAAAAAAARVGGAPVPAPSEKLDFTIQKQQQDYWCWAAVSASIANFYNAATSWTQCRIATVEKDAPCCEDGSSKECNQAYALDQALERTDNLRDFLDRTLDASEIRTEIHQKSPLGCRIAWNATEGHFLVINGYEEPEGQLWVDVEDPDRSFDASTYPYDEFANRYRGIGRWTHSYLTRAASAGGGAAPPRASRSLRPTSVTN